MYLFFRVHDLDHQRQVGGQAQDFRRVQPAGFAEPHRPAKHRRAGQVQLPSPVHKSPTTTLESKSPIPLTVANTPKAMPCCFLPASSAQSESSKVSSSATFVPPSTKISARAQMLVGSVMMQSDIKADIK